MSTCSGLITLGFARSPARMNRTSWPADRRSDAKWAGEDGELFRIGIVSSFSIAIFAFTAASMRTEDRRHGTSAEMNSKTNRMTMTGRSLFCYQESRAQGIIYRSKVIVNA